MSEANGSAAELAQSRVIRIVAAIILNADERMLLVRKRGTLAFMQPGGKIEAGESSAEALVRELSEEVGVALSVDSLAWVGRFGAAAANEAGFTVDCDVFFVRVDERGAVAAEIEELAWVDPRAMDHLVLAPLTADVLRPHILALLQ